MKACFVLVVSAALVGSFCACDRSAVPSQQTHDTVGTLPKLAAMDSVQTEPAVSNSPSLQAIGQKALDALRNGDATFFASVVDKEGIALGTDNPLTTATEFRQELKSRTGAYCDLFGCDGARNSVRALLSGKSLAVRALVPKGSPGEGQVSVLEVKPGQTVTDASPSAVIMLVFVDRAGKWRLRVIDYT